MSKSDVLTGPNILTSLTTLSSSLGFRDPVANCIGEEGMSIPISMSTNALASASGEGESMAEIGNDNGNVISVKTSIMASSLRLVLCMGVLGRIPIRKPSFTSSILPLNISGESGNLISLNTSTMASSWIPGWDGPGYLIAGEGGSTMLDSMSTSTSSHALTNVLAAADPPICLFLKLPKAALPRYHQDKYNRVDIETLHETFLALSWLSQGLGNGCGWVRVCHRLLSTSDLHWNWKHTRDIEPDSLVLGNLMSMGNPCGWWVWVHHGYGWGYAIYIPMTHAIPTPWVSYIFAVKHRQCFGHQVTNLTPIWVYIVRPDSQTLDMMT